VANNTTMTILDLLLATDAQSANGVLYNGIATKRAKANTGFHASIRPATSVEPISRQQCEGWPAGDWNCASTAHSRP